MKLDREQWGMVAALATVAVVATLLLGVTDWVTRQPIAEARKAALHEALSEVLPPHANDVLNDAVRIGEGGGDGANPTVLYPARDAAGKLLALAWEVVAPDGYSGSIRIMMGVNPDGSIHAVRVTDHRETPGLGDGIVKDKAWVDAFADDSLTNTRWAVKKDGGDFDQFTGATITPRAVVKAVKKGLEFFRDRHDAITAKLAAGMGGKGGAQ